MSKTPNRGMTDRNSSDGLFKVDPSFWSLTPGALLESLRSTAGGLTQRDASTRRDTVGPNAIQERTDFSALRLLLAQFRSPLVLILIFAATVSLSVGEWTDATIVLVVVFGSTILGFVQEYRASVAVELLRKQVTVRSDVLRDGAQVDIPSEDVVPGDVVLLSAGSLIPADGVVLEANDFFVNQAVLTGETFPVQKDAESVAPNAALAARSNCVFMGTSATSGSARALVVHTGSATVFGEVAHRLRLRPPETEFERGIRRFGNMLTQVMLVMVVLVLAANAALGKPVIDSLLFSLALAVGLTPELLPAIISITLARGAQRMAKRGVIVRTLAAIENLGSMDVLCTDKTGTLTEGVVRLDAALNVDGASSNDVLRFALINARMQMGMRNALDDAIVSHAAAHDVSLGDVQKVAEVPYDFVRKCLSIVVDEGSERFIVTKGALAAVLSRCTAVTGTPSERPLDAALRADIDRRFSEWSEKGFRVLGVATKRVGADGHDFSREDEQTLTFAGFLLFFDPPKQDVREVIGALSARGVQLKIITGDNEKVARFVAGSVGLHVESLLTGSAMATLRDEALWHVAERTTVFAEVDPNQKERIILALQKTRHVVGYMGDGINDAPALHAADVGISVDTAVDVAKDAADFVLLRTSLGILRDGIDEGRRTFVNTLKYILTTVSANFGNMFSMAFASVVLPFLPLLAPQILLNNFLSDIPAMTIAGDNVDADWVAKPRRWDTRFIRSYMIVFGLVSAAFDFLTFGALLFLFRATPEEFRTGWFIESLLTELVIALVVRTRHPFYRSRPSAALLWSSIAFIAITLVMPYLPFDQVFGFIPLPIPLLLSVVGLTVLYVVAAEITKTVFYRHVATANE